MGTPSYMAPEQAQGLTHQIGPPVDIYALGAILYEMLTGRPPFKGPTVVETIRQVVYEDPVPPSRLQSRVARDLETISLKCLAKAPARRYATADDLADDLDRFLAGETIHARPTPFWERGAKWARRRPLTAALTGTLIAAAAGLAVAAQRYSAYTQDRIRRQDEQVARARLEAIDDLDRGRLQRAKGELENTRVTLASLQTKLRAQPRLADLLKRADGEMAQVKSLQSAVANRSADVERFNRFGQLRDQALLLDGYAALVPETLSAEAAGEAAPGERGQPAIAPRGGPTGRTRDAARAALAVFAPPGAGPVPTPVTDSTTLSPEQRAQVESGCYLMLMVLAEAVGRPLPGEDPKHQVDRALSILDRTTALRAPTAAFHLCRADNLERRGDARAAQLERARAAALKPADAFDDLLLGREAFLKGEWDAARSHCEAALSRRADLFWARCLLAIAELNTSPPRAAEAKTELTTCLIQQPSYPWLYLLRGTAYGQMGSSLAFAARAAGHDGSRLAAEAEARFDNAESDFHTASELGLDQSLGYVLLMNRGVMRFQRGTFPEAAADFEKAIALDPKRFNAYASLAQVLRKLGRKSEAVERLGKAIEIEPGLAALYRGRALARLDGASPATDDAEASLHDLETAARLEPAGSRAAAGVLTLRSQLLLRLRRPAEAIADANAALAIASDSGRAHLARIAALLALEKYDDVISSCDAALAAGYPSSDLYRLRGLARYGRNDFAGAIDDYNQALALAGGGRAETYRHRGWAHLFSNAAELALRDFDASLHLEPDEAEGYAGRGAARVRLGDVRGAIADAEESVRRDSQSARLLYVAAETYSLASAHTGVGETRRGRASLRDSLAYEARAAELLERSLDQKRRDEKPTFWRDVVSRDPALRPIFQNPRIRRRLDQRAGALP